MSEPIRWNDPRGNAPAGVRSLLDAARAAPPLTPAVRAETAAFVAGLGVGAAPPGLLSVGAVRALAAVVAVTAAGVALHTFTPSTHPSPRSVAAAHAAAPARAPAPAAVPVPVPTTAPPFETTAPRVVPPPLPRAAVTVPSPVGSLPAHVPHHPTRPVTALPSNDDAHLLEHARAALVTEHRPRVALAALHRHARHFPHSPLTEERAYLTVRALEALGLSSQARAQATAFMIHYPAGIYTSAVQQLLERLP